MTDERCSALAGAFCDRLSPAETALVHAAVTAPIFTNASYGFDDLGNSAVTALRALADIADPTTRANASAAVIALLAADAPERFAQLSLPQDIAARAARWQDVLVEFLEGGVPADYHFPEDMFLKDYRFVTALTVPCGAQVVDLAERVGPKTILKLAPRHPRLAIAAATGRWLRPHTESRYLDEFNRAGWDACYLRMAGLMTRDPAVRGMIATSWFYDPQLDEVSPRLAYLRADPMARGAVLVAHGTTPFDIHSATATSPTRLRLHQEGRYTPVCCSIIWPRDALLAWAARGGEAHVSATA